MQVIPLQLVTLKVNLLSQAHIHIQLPLVLFLNFMEEYTSDTANPVLSFKRGSTYVLNINTTSLHPFWIQTSDNGGSYDSANVYSSGITNNGIYDGTITFVVPMDAPDTLYYRCSNHGNWGNSISITSALSKTGIAKVFQYNTTDSSWNQVGSNIDGSGENDFFGSSIAMDSSGEFVAVGGPFAGDARCWTCKSIPKCE